MSLVLKMKKKYDRVKYMHAYNVTGSTYTLRYTKILIMPLIKERYKKFLAEGWTIYDFRIMPKTTTFKLKLKASPDTFFEVLFDIKYNFDYLHK